MSWADLVPAPFSPFFPPPYVQAKRTGDILIMSTLQNHTHTSGGGNVWMYHKKESLCKPICLICIITLNECLIFEMIYTGNSSPELLKLCVMASIEIGIIFREHWVSG